ncbi:DUF2786 domain-containing protein [Flavobacterium fluviatile]|uniref:DUF2786 domain-containing protein n=1 Tax=Flavobacterium fluviatile TaxID=1862387 RepID=UPI0013D39AC5|nr:DUF2786 domain-containing protein [Flavobacterium fluviatile]
MTNSEKIKDKIKALLAKTIENGATKEEMESALKKANKLMAEYFISEHDLSDSEIIQKCLAKQFKVTKSGYRMTLFYHDLAILFDCKCYYNDDYITFFGHEQDVELCGYFYSLITRSCLAEKDRYVKSEEYKYLKRYNHGKTLSAHFIKGFLYEISIKMEEMYKERESNIPEAYGLMVIEKKEKVQISFDEMNLKLKKGRKTLIDSQNQAFECGVESGRKLDLIQGLDECEEANHLSLSM